MNLTWLKPLRRNKLVLLLHATLTKPLLLLIPTLIERCLLLLAVLLKTSVELTLPKAGILLHHGSQLQVGIAVLLLLVNH